MPGKSLLQRNKWLIVTIVGAPCTLIAIPLLAYDIVVFAIIFSSPTINIFNIEKDQWFFIAFLLVMLIAGGVGLVSFWWWVFANFYRLTRPQLRKLASCMLFACLGIPFAAPYLSIYTGALFFDSPSWWILIFPAMAFIVAIGIACEALVQVRRVAP